MLGGESFFKNIVDNTNKYAEHCRNLENIDKDWVEVTYDEMVAYFGVLMYMGVFNLPESRDYWQSQEIDCPIIRHCMTFSRYCQITKPLLTVMDTFHHKYNPGRELVIDEAMVAFKGRHYIKQYMKGKSTKRGFKIWILASPHGYVLQGNVYLGKKEKRNKDMLLGSQVVINLLEKQLGLNHYVVGLMNALYDNKTYVCATTRQTHKEWPTELKFPKKLKLKRGESKSLQRGKVTSMSVMLYTKCMGGVDRADQFRSYYGFGRTTKKWWKYLFAFVVNTAIVNSYILFKETTSLSFSRHGPTQKDFRLALYKQMIGNFTSRKISCHKRTLPFASSSTKYMEEKKRVLTAAIRKDEHLRGDALKLHGNAEAVICLYVNRDVFLLIMKKKEWTSVTNNTIRSVGDDFLYDIDACESAREAWEILEEIHNSSTKFHALQALKEMVNVSKGSDVSMQEYTGKIQRLNKKVAKGGIQFTDELLANLFLAGLPADEYEIFVQNVLKEPVLTTRLVKGRMLDEERRRQQQMASESEATALATFRGRTGKTKPKPYVGHQDTGEPEVRNCFKCRKPGHISKYCPTVDCRKCGKYGHWAKDCTNERKEVQNVGKVANMRSQASRGESISCVSV
ncbi:hypothetical protein J437_LFUL016087 [Ladona fulva]|uniref:CCHC-type domain-containing protein n=1 Tax=Ladona fulva TaxID=123851 RepID=A0A8K0KL33_LADFU|nr:hypothetical protein J437_LFUL016087 [Ladona fulva]